MERLLLRDRAGPNGGLPDSVVAAGGNPDARDALLVSSPHDDVAAANTAAAAGRRRMKTPGKGSPVRFPAPKDVKAVRSLTLLVAPIQNL